VPTIGSEVGDGQAIAVEWGKYIEMISEKKKAGYDRTLFNIPSLACVVLIFAVLENNVLIKD